MPYRAQRGGAFGGGVTPQEPAQIDVGGAIDALMGGTGSLIRQAMLRKEHQAQMARQQQQDEWAKEDRTTAKADRERKIANEDRSIRWTEEDRKRREELDRRKLEIEDAELRSKGYTPAQTKIASAMGGSPFAPAVPMLHQAPATFDPRQGVDYAIEHETDAREHGQSIELENLRAKNSRITQAMTRSQAKADRDEERARPENREKHLMSVAKTAVAAAGGDLQRAAQLAVEDPVGRQAYTDGLATRHFQAALRELEAEQAQADQAAAIRLQAVEGYTPEEAAAMVAQTRARTTANTAAARPKPASPPPRPARPAAPSPMAAGNPSTAPRDTAKKPPATSGAKPATKADTLARAKAALDRIPLGSPNRARAEAYYKSLGGKL